MKTRIVVTGMGAITSIRDDMKNFQQGLKDKTVGIGPIIYFNIAGHKCKLTVEIKGFDPKQYMDAKAARRMEALSQFTVVISKETLEQSGTDMEEEDPYHVGVCVGSGIGSLQAMERDVKKSDDKGSSCMNPLLIPLMMNSMATGNVATQSGLKGKCFNVVTVRVTETHFIGKAFRSTQYGEADVMMAGGAEASITPIGIAGFTSFTALSTTEDVSGASIPFNEDRNGFVMGEGVGVVVLESLEHAKARGANIPAEVMGYGAICDALHIISPTEDGGGTTHAIENAMKDADITAEDIGYVNAHDISTHHNNLFEARATKLALGDYTRKIEVNSTKSMIDHLLEAAGGVEFVTCVKSIQDGFVHVTAGLKKSGEGCDPDYTMGDGVSMSVDVVISNSLGFGGHNASLIVKKFSK